MADVIGWEGLVLPYEEISPVGDPRVVMPTTLAQLSRPLPLPVKVQWSSASGHDNAEQGLASITRVWSTDDGLWASGPIDIEDERGAAFARKLAAGFLGTVSADIETDGGQVVSTASGRRPVFRNWLLTGVTLVGDPAFAAARIYPVTDPARITPVDEVRVIPKPETFAAVEYVTFTTGTRTRLERTSLMADDDTAENTNEGTGEAFAVAEPAIDAGLPIEDADPAEDTESGGISDADIARIADAVVARLDERDMEASAEYSRIRDAYAALNPEEAELCQVAVAAGRPEVGARPSGRPHRNPSQNGHGRSHGAKTDRLRRGHGPAGGPKKSPRIGMPP